MPALTTSLSSLASSILDTLTSVLTSVLTSILGIFEHLLSLVWGVFAPFFDAVGTAISGLAQTFSGVLKFILSNILVVALFAAAVFLYGAYQQRTPTASGTRKKAA